MLQGEDGVNAPTAVGRANSSGAYRAHRNRGCRWDLNPPASSSDLAT
ncbi:hypothetical protein ACFPRL_36300 [Pseudoclavibacter helvolus]